MWKLSFRCFFLRKKLVKKPRKKQAVVVGGGEVAEVVGGEEVVEVIVGGVEVAEVVGGGDVAEVEGGGEVAEVEGGGEVAVVEANLPVGDAFMAMTYPPSFYLLKKRQVEIQMCPRQLCVHGLWEIKSKKRTKHFGKKYMSNYKFDKVLLERINTVMPQLGGRTAEKHLRKQIKKHGPYLRFLTTIPDYVMFTLNVYERYGFATMMKFIVETIQSEQIGQTERCLEVDYLGVTVNHFRRIANSYPPLGAGQLGIELVRHDNRFFLKEVTICVTKEGLAAQLCTKQEKGVFVNGERGKPVDPEAYIWLVAEANEDSESDMDSDQYPNTHSSWRDYELRTERLSQELAEQLRLIMEPTLASKLQVVIAVDDSRRMSESRFGDFAIEALVTVCRALSQLEVGKLAVTSFGRQGNVSLLHDFDQPFTGEAGMQMISSLTFNQENTIVGEPVVDLLRYLKNIPEHAAATTSAPSGQNPLQQLVLIISNGRFHENTEKMKQRVSDLLNSNRMVAFLLLDSAEKSITDHKIWSFDKNEATPKPYLDSFPFPYYIVLKNIEALPRNLADLLRKLFELMQNSRETNSTLRLDNQ